MATKQQLINTYVQTFQKAMDDALTKKECNCWIDLSCVTFPQHIERRQSREIIEAASRSISTKASVVLNYNRYFELSSIQMDFSASKPVGFHIDYSGRVK